MNAEEVIRRPIAMTEKATLMKVDNNQVVFEVALAANKAQIRSAVEELFGVKVADVNTLVQRGKIKRVGRRPVKRPNWKKAIVTLGEGHDIQFFSEAEDSEEE